MSSIFHWKSWNWKLAVWLLRCLLLMHVLKETWSHVQAGVPLSASCICMSVFGARVVTRAAGWTKWGWEVVVPSVPVAEVQLCIAVRSHPALLSVLTVVPDGSCCQLQHWLLSARCPFGSLPVPLETSCSAPRHCAVDKHRVGWVADADSALSFPFICCLRARFLAQEGSTSGVLEQSALI